MKISKGEIAAIQQQLSRLGVTVGNVTATDFFPAALTVRKRLKRERKVENSPFKPISDKGPDYKGPKWDGRMNVWIPWTATATSECPVPEGARFAAIYGSGYRGNSVWTAPVLMWNLRPASSDIIIAYMVTSIKEPSA